ncbi:MAG TPA: hypothetical protein VFP35_04330 [Candidatus Saccharimonadales bacterium]|nr:hypothetical protein [Candidatus Saccharimonadales bacterium]
MDPQANRSRKTAIIAVLAVLLIISLIFGFWAFSGRQDYKNNVNTKVASAVSQAKSQQSATDKTYYTQLAEQPYKTFSGPSTYGSVTFSYPKNWSAYVDETSANEPVDGYFAPDVVPGIQSDTAFPLRVELVDSDYSDVVNQFEPQVSQGSLTSAAFMPAKLKNSANVQAGVRLDGIIGQDNNNNPLKGSMVILKVRDKTLEIYTQTTSSLQEFDNIILPSLTFAP